MLLHAMLQQTTMQRLHRRSKLLIPCGETAAPCDDA